MLRGVQRRFAADDPHRAPDLERSSDWVDGLRTQGFSVTEAPLHLTGGLPEDLESLAENFARLRLESQIQSLMPAARQTAGKKRDHQIHVRPLRSRLHSALTIPVNREDALILVDDAVIDLIGDLVRLMAATWPASDFDSDDPPLLSLPDAVRVARVAVGSIRWNGALWQPIQIDLSPNREEFASVVSTLAILFVLAHEMGHAELHLPSATAVVPHDDPAREGEADTFAYRTLHTHLTATGGSFFGYEPATVTDLVLLGARCALEILGLADRARMVRPGRTHHVPLERVSALQVADKGGRMDSPMQAWVTRFFAAIAAPVRVNAMPLSRIVASTPQLAFAKTYDADVLAELDEIDAAETVLHAPMLTLLHSLSDAIPLDMSKVPHEVARAAANADRTFASAAGQQSVGTDAWIRSAAGYIWLVDVLLGGRTQREATETLHPAPATRFADWALWLADSCPPSLEMTTMAALAILRDEGPDAVAKELTQSKLVDEVRHWVQIPASSHLLQASDSVSMDGS